MGKSEQHRDLAADRRPIGLIHLAKAPFQIIFAHIPAAAGLLWSRRQEVILLLVGMLIFLSVYVISFCITANAAPSESLGRLWRYISSALYDFRTELTLTMIAYFVARVVQHVNDWRNYQVTWAQANCDRLSHKSFPCLILGRGGSGKSTLAGLLEYDFLRRLVLRPSGFVDVGAGENLVARTPKEIGEAIGRYEVSWRPREMKVGHRAKACDLPGQLLDDWQAAIKNVGKCERVAIVNVLTFGYNAEIRKYGEVEKILPDSKEFCVKNFHEPDFEKQNARPNHIRYFKHVFKKESVGFQCIANTIINTWPKGDASPKLVLINLVTMAKHWEHPENRIQSVDAEVERHYRKLFSNEIEMLKSHLGDHFAMTFLPASLQWGDMRHEWFKNKDASPSAEEKDDSEMLLFKALQRVELEDFSNGLTNPENATYPDYETRAKYRIQTKKHLADMSIQSLRIIRHELYRKKSNWATSTNKIVRTDGKEIDWSLTPTKDERNKGAG